MSTCWFVMSKAQQFLWNVVATDVAFGYDGRLYVSDWIQGMSGHDAGRIFTVWEEKSRLAALAAGTGKLMAEGFAHRDVLELTTLLAHADMRVRQRAQFALVDRPQDGLMVFSRLLKSRAPQNSTTSAPLERVTTRGLMRGCRNRLNSPNIRV